MRVTQQIAEVAQHQVADNSDRLLVAQHLSAVVAGSRVGGSEEPTRRKLHRRPRVEHARVHLVVELGNAHARTQVRLIDRVQTQNCNSDVT